MAAARGESSFILDTAERRCPLEPGRAPGWAWTVHDADCLTGSLEDHRASAKTRNSGEIEQEHGMPCPFDVGGGDDTASYDWDVGVFGCDPRMTDDEYRLAPPTPRASRPGEGERCGDCPIRRKGVESWDDD